MDTIHTTGQQQQPEDSHNRDLLIRIDERTRTMQKTLDQTSDKVTGVEGRVTTLEAKISELSVVKLIVFSGVGLVLLTVLGAILRYVVLTAK